MNRVDRLTAMILMLQSHRVVTADQLAQHFELSVRTVYRDIAALGEAGVPIVAEAGVGYSLMRGYHVPPIMFTEEEAAALFLSGELIEQFGDESLKGSFRTALLKVRAALPGDRKDYLSRLGHVVEIYERSPGRDDRSLMPVQEAVVRRRCLAIKYDAGGRGEITERVVEPLGVVFYGRHWHLVGWCRLRRAMRDFRLDRLQALEVTEEVFQGHEEFSLMDYLRNEVDRDELTPVIFECECWGLERVMADMPAELESHEETAEGRVRVKALAYSVNWLAGWLVGLGSSAAVIEPEELGLRVRDIALAIAGKYGRTRGQE